MPRKRKQVRLGRLRKSVHITNRIYGLLVQAFDSLRGEHIALLNRLQSLERHAGLQWSDRDEQHTPGKADL